MSKQTIITDQLLYNNWFRKPSVLQTYLFILLASDDKGHIITTLQTISNATGLTFRQIRTALSVLQNDKQIDKQTTNKKTIINVLQKGSCDYHEIEYKTKNDKQNDKQNSTFLSELKVSDTFLESASMNFHATREDIILKLNEFDKECQAKGTTHCTFSNYRRHAYDWCRIQFDKQIRYANNTTARKTKHERDTETANVMQRLYDDNNK